MDVSHTLAGACPDTHQRIQTNYFFFYPEIKATPFHWVCVESLCFPLGVFIYPSANNGQLTSQFFRESVLPLSQSLNLLAGLFYSAVSSGEIPWLKIIYTVLSPLFLRASNIFTQQSEVWTSSDRIHKVPILGVGDRCECLRRVGGQRQQPAVCVI